LGISSMMRLLAQRVVSSDIKKDEEINFISLSGTI
jgi:hypothetical protein